MAKFKLPTEAQRERLDMLAEEAAEVIKCVTKINRHGLNSFNPDNRGAGTNKQMLQKELLDLFTIYERLVAEFDLDRIDFNHTAQVWKRKIKYTRHQPPFSHPMDGEPRVR